MVFLVTSLLVLLSAFILGGSRFEWVEIARSLWWEIVVLHILSSLLLWRTVYNLRRKLLFLAQLGILVGYAVVLRPSLYPDSVTESPQTSQKIQIALFDLQKTADEETLIRLLFAKELPEILFLIGYSPQWEKTLKLAPQFAYHFFSQGKKEESIAVFSAFPLSKESTFQRGDDLPQPLILSAFMLPSKKEVSIALGVGMWPEEGDLFTDRVFFRRIVSYYRERKTMPAFVVTRGMGGPLSPLYRIFLWAADFTPAATISDFSRKRMLHSITPFPPYHLLVRQHGSITNYHELTTMEGEPFGFSTSVSY